MYDFYLGESPKSLDQEIRYLVSVKRLLPRWCNSIPDAEFSAIVRILHDIGKKADQEKQKLCLVETGVGASTIALVYFAIKHKGAAYTWDFNTKKGSEIRTVCNETFCNALGLNANQYWKLIGYNSLSPYLGLSVLGEWTDRVHFSLHDSEHTWAILEGELKAVDRYLFDGSVVAVDDAYYDFLHTDTAYINIIRKKLGLKPISPLADNKSQPHWMASMQFLKDRWENVAPFMEDYKKACHDDVSIAYFNNELELRSELGNQRVQQLEQRFAVWQIYGRLKAAPVSPNRQYANEVAR